MKAMKCDVKGICSHKAVRKSGSKLNCWEMMRCGREKSGRCPAVKDKRLDGIYGGKNAGRACWLVAGTLCGGRAHGTFAQKHGNCATCAFYRMVSKEERDFSLSIDSLVQAMAR